LLEWIAPSPKVGISRVQRNEKQFFGIPSGYDVLAQKSFLLAPQNFTSYTSNVVLQFEFPQNISQETTVDLELLHMTVFASWKVQEL